jgi:signal transduction histidine kinase
MVEYPNPSAYPALLSDPRRLQAMKALGLVDSPAEEVFDRLTRLASKLIPSPVALISIVDDERQYFKSIVGLKEPWASQRQTPLTHSFCQHVTVTGQPLIIENSRETPLVRDSLAIPDLDVISYLGMPLSTSEGIVLGSFCVIDSVPRKWTEADIETVRELARSVMTEIELRNEVNRLKALEAEREKLMRNLKDINHDLEDFAYIVSHDLKAPLRGISAIADWLGTDYMEVLDADGQEMLALLRTRVQRLQDFIDGILRYSRVGRVEDEWEDVPVQALVEDVIAALQTPHIRITIENVLPTVYGGRVRLGQVFQNLISNAIKFMDKPDGQITIRSETTDHDWVFYVTDNGPGIEERHFQKIFQIFQTLNARDDVESTGIGLTLVKKIVEMHGGTVTVQSKVGAGSTFSFTLSRDQAHHEARTSDPDR